MSIAGWKTMAGLLVLIAFTGAVEACHSPTAPEATITGTVHFYALEGGFWAVPCLQPSSRKTCMCRLCSA